MTMRPDDCFQTWSGEIDYISLLIGRSQDCGDNNDNDYD